MAEEAQAGTVINGRYRLVERLGAGGFGRVWSARDEMLGIDVAVKEVWLPPALSDAERSERLTRAEREARNAARLRDHPNIVAVYDMVMDDGAPWIVMQLVVGHSLDERLRIRGGSVTLAETAAIAVGVLGALEAAHAAGVVHRDIKPGNVLLTDDGKVLLADFGIAVHQADTALTATGAFIGSMEYVAPERARGTDGLAASDLFSLGATLYQAVEGFSPFRRDTPTGSLTAVLFEEPPPPRRAGDLAPLLVALLAKDPEARPSAHEASAILGKKPSGAAEPAATAVSQLPETVVPSRTAGVSAPDRFDPWPRAAPTEDALSLPGRPGRRRMRPRTVVAAGVVLAAVAGAGIWWAAQSGSGAATPVAGPPQDQLDAALLTDADFGNQYPESSVGGYRLDLLQYPTNGVCAPMDKAVSLVEEYRKTTQSDMNIYSYPSYKSLGESVAYYGIDDAKKMMTFLHQEDQCSTPFRGGLPQPQAFFPLAAPTGTSDDCAALDVRINGGAKTVETIVVARVGGALIVFNTRDETSGAPEIIDSDQMTAAVNKLHSAGIPS